MRVGGAGWAQNGADALHHVHQDRMTIPAHHSLGSRKIMVEWIVSQGLTDYRAAESWMEQRATAIAAGQARECIWLVEHPPLYTAGTSAKPQDLRDPDRFDVYQTRRGGQYTYHGPGQRVAYTLLDVGARGRDVRKFVQDLERWVIATLDTFNVVGEIRPGRVGVWVQRPEKPASTQGQIAEDKIAAIGIRLRKWISFHGLSINVDPTLDHFDGIVPCGIAEHGVTSLVDLGLPVTLYDLDVALKSQFSAVFGDVPHDVPDTSVGAFRQPAPPIAQPDESNPRY